jgi:hypothetical protein
MHKQQVMVEVVRILEHTQGIENVKDGGKM